MTRDRNRPFEAAVPKGGRAENFLNGADFCDTWGVDVPSDNRSVLGLFIQAMTYTPRWVDVCMDMRNRVVAAFGLKNLGGLAAVLGEKPGEDYQPGDRVGIFTVFENGFDEAVIGDKDKHLDVFLCLHRQQGKADGRALVRLTTIVHVKNALGHLYMVPVKPMHRLIAPTVLRALCDKAV